MSLYAWKISSSERSVAECVSTLAELVAFLENSDLPRTRRASDIISQTLAMEHEGQGVYRHRTAEEEWTLLWVARHARSRPNDRV